MERVRECFNQIYWSWKIILSMMFLLACLIIGFHNSERLKRTGLSNIPRQLYELSTDYGSKLYDYQARIRMPKVKMELLRVGSHNLESNSQEILSLTKQIDILKALLKDIKNKMDNYILNPNTEAFGKQDDSDITNEEMVILVNYVLKKLREDQVQMADYALKSAGASIVEAGTSESYKNDKAKLYWHGIGFLSYEMPPDVILQGLKEECKGEEIFLGQFMYNKKGTSVQTFHLQNEVSEYLLCVKLKILNNWGHPKYTCLYRFRVHGKPETDGLGAP
ncbi:SUN domain-containing protein 3 isoform X3 [Monodelphis domestica]|uniref:SUN domain-containing protein 3 isoform X3 n=1 Tax=Monodelphis domestica TaxID=13616 RepID=UPI00044357F2|nr:SUN domain-containing protein 3 isoform X3 [Monodelphis domestica]